MRLLLLEDDPILGQGLRAFLQAEGHVVDWCRRVDQARALSHDPFDTLLVDWQLPDGSGVDWIRSLRAHGNRTPALVLTARDLLTDRIHGLDSGADDYLVKPFEPEELSARIRAVRRRSAGEAESRLCFGDIALDLAGRSAWRDGEPLTLTAREWAITEALALRAGRFVAKADLEALVLGMDGEVSSNALEVHIYSLRKKVGRARIENSRGLGYRWVTSGD
ncbi:MAG: response regulator transcription factor [Burkholderiaceae bacterium]|nr:response regulator transcription factor [Burkholderiaceae bacterium]